MQFVTHYFCAREVVEALGGVYRGSQRYFSGREGCHLCGDLGVFSCGGVPVAVMKFAFISRCCDGWMIDVFVTLTLVHKGGGELDSF